MEIKISKSDYSSLLALIDKAVSIIRCKAPTTREYNVARQLGNIKKKVQRNNKNEKYEQSVYDDKKFTQ